MRFFLKATLGLFGVMVLSIGIALPFGFNALNAFATANSRVATAQAVFKKEKDFVKIAEVLELAASDLNRANANLSKIQYLKILPFVGPQVKSASVSARAAEMTVQSLATVSQSAGKILTFLGEADQIRVGDIAENTRRKIFNTLKEDLPKLREAGHDLDSADALLSELNPNKLIEPLAQRIEKLSAGVRLGKELIDDALPLLEAGINILGHPEPKTYLLILQNSDELRPSGGFIGTYGIITFDSGHITNFFTDDVYNLDRFSPPSSRPLAPSPLARYLEQPRFYLRDANWSPDFPTSAKTALQFYKEEAIYGGKASGRPEALPQDIDGVIALMPEAIIPLLKVVGPITVSGQKFTAENFTDALEYEVEIKFDEKGIPRTQRKEIVSQLGHVLIEKLLVLPSSSWPQILHSIAGSLQEKHILVAATDPGLQALLAARNWNGAIIQVPSDYLGVFDANLFSLKTDPYVERNIFYRAGKDARGQLIGEVEVVYTYPKAGPDWKTKGYRSFTRVYVPKGAILISASGAMEDEFSKPGQVEITQEFNKTVFGSFVAVQVGEVKRLHFIYRLPDKVAAQVEAGAYELLVQKQPGTLGHGLTVALDFGKVPRVWSPRGLQVSKDGSQTIWQTDLRQDQQFKVEF